MTEAQTFKNIYRQLKEDGKIVKPRGLKVLEIENFQYKFEPYVRFVNFPSRKLNLDYIKREFQWYLKADQHDLSITNHAKLWQDMVTKNQTINSNYGQYLFGSEGQIHQVFKTLLDDKDSRRASMVILSKQHILSNDKDLPCTYALNFRIRSNKLNMSVHMRSQDAIYGLASDIPAFSFIHEMVWTLLKDHYKQLKYGTYHHSVDSLHVYEKHFKLLNDILNDKQFEPIKCPKIKNRAEVLNLLKSKYDKQYKFSRWLNT